MKIASEEQQTTGCTVPKRMQRKDWQPQPCLSITRCRRNCKVAALRKFAVLWGVFRVGQSQKKVLPAAGLRRRSYWDMLQLSWHSGCTSISPKVLTISRPVPNDPYSLQHRARNVLGNSNKTEMAWLKLDNERLFWISESWVEIDNLFATFGLPLLPYLISAATHFISP